MKVIALFMPFGVRNPQYEPVSSCPLSSQNTSSDSAVSSTVNPLHTKRSKVKTELDSSRPLSPCSPVISSFSPYRLLYDPNGGLISGLDVGDMTVCVLAGENYSCSETLMFSYIYGFK